MVSTCSCFSTRRIGFLKRNACITVFCSKKKKQEKRFACFRRYSFMRVYEVSSAQWASGGCSQKLVTTYRPCDAVTIPLRRNSLAALYGKEVPSCSCDRCTKYSSQRAQLFSLTARSQTKTTEQTILSPNVHFFFFFYRTTFPRHISL